MVVAASVEKAALMGEVAKRYNASDRQVNGSCYGISVNAMASGVVESRLAEASWDPAWGPAPDAWSPAASIWLQLLRHDRASHDRPDILAADNESVVSTPIVLAMPEPKAKALGWPRAAIGWSDLLDTSPTTREDGHPRATPSGVPSSWARPTPTCPRPASRRPSEHSWPLPGRPAT